MLTQHVADNVDTCVTCAVQRCADLDYANKRPSLDQVCCGHYTLPISNCRDSLDAFFLFMYVQ